LLTKTCCFSVSAGGLVGRTVVNRVVRRAAKATVSSTGKAKVLAEGASSYEYSAVSRGSLFVWEGSLSRLRRPKLAGCSMEFSEGFCILQSRRRRERITAVGLSVFGELA
jgi:hypothetical protein